MHRYLKLTAFDRVTLRFAKSFFPDLYREEKNALIRDYAAKIRDELNTFVMLQRDLIAKKQAEEKTLQEQQEMQGLNAQKHNVDTTYESAVRQKTAEEQRIESLFEEQRRKEEQQRAVERADIEARTDAEKIVKATVQERLLKSSLLLTEAGGSLSFNDRKLVEKLEDRFLDQILGEIQAEEGRPGFFTRLREQYQGVTAYYEEIADPGEIPDVDWLESIIHSRMKGYRFPTYPYLLVGHPAPEHERAAAALDTAIALDISGSMAQNDRFTIAQKAILAQHSLMRRLHPRNTSRLAWYSDSLTEGTTADLMKRVKPDGWTFTYKALDWLIEVLKDKPLAIAYLATDGYPNHRNGAYDAMPITLESAKKFRDHPNILLRVFLIDGDKESEGLIRQIGQAAGDQTRVIPVKNYRLPNGMIKDVADSIGEMYALA